jgi:hypothetical protein
VAGNLTEKELQLFEALVQIKDERKNEGASV